MFVKQAGEGLKVVVSGRAVILVVEVGVDMFTSEYSITLSLLEKDV